MLAAGPHRRAPVPAVYWLLMLEPDLQVVRQVLVQVYLLHRPSGLQNPGSAALWSLLIAAIWLWVAAGFWNLRAYAVQFGLFISLFTLIWGFFALLFGNTTEAGTIPWLLAGAIFLYLSYPGVQQAFVENEKSKLTPEQVAAMEQLDAANRAAAAKPAPGMGKPEDTAAAAPKDPPATS